MHNIEELLATVPATGRLSFGGLLQVLNRRKVPIITCATLLIMLASGVILLLPDRYTAEGVLMLSARNAQVVNLPAVVPELQTDLSMVRSQIEVLKSLAVAQKVVVRLGLDRNEEFAQTDGRLASRLRALSEKMRRIFSLSTGVDRPATIGTDRPRGEEERARDVVASVVAGRLSVDSDGHSYAIKVRFTARNPDLAAKIVNAYLAVYLQDQLSTKQQETGHANNWLESKLSELQGRVHDSDRAVALYREQHHLTEARGETVIVQQMAELNSQLTIATSDRAQKESALNQANAAMHSGRLESLPTITSAYLIQRLREQEAQLVRRQAEVKTQYLSNHPAAMDVTAELRDLRQKIANEADKLVDSLANDVRAARAREEALQAHLHDLEGQAGESARLAVELSALQDQAETNRVLYRGFLERSKQVSFQTELQEPDARLVATAIVPQRPSFPDRSTLLVISVVLAIATSILLAFLLERLDDGFHSTGEIREKLGVDPMGLFPEVGGLSRTGDCLSIEVQATRKPSARSAFRSDSQ